VDEETFNISTRKFLKKLGVTSQREIEMAVRDAIESGRLSGSERLPARAVVSVEGLDEEIVIEGEIALEE
jgi:Family of unknown function (DUF6494)